jgi:hypothetical protein
MDVKHDITPMVRGLFHVHTLLSDGQLSIPDVAALARCKNCSLVSILDHACVAGCMELYGSLVGTNVKVIMGYEHSLGDTDIGVLGVEEVLPSWWTIQQIAESVHGQGGSVIYLHPMRDGECHFVELASWIDKGFVDGWEWRNNLNISTMDKNMYPRPAVWGCDLHDKDEIVKIPDGGMELPRFLLKHVITSYKQLPIKGYDCRKLQQFDLAFGHCVLETDGNFVRIHLSFNMNWGGSEQIDVNGDCFEIALGDNCGSAFGELISFSMGKEGLMATTLLLTDEGVVASVQNNAKHLINARVIDNRNFVFGFRPPHDCFAFSISAKSVDAPSLRRFSWPAPVWPPRRIQNLADVR